MSWIQIILFLIKNFGTIKRIIEELVNLFKGLSGDARKDEQVPIRQAKGKVKDLADMFGVACPPDLVRD